MTIEELIQKACAEGGSDIHLVKGLPPRFRRDGQIEDMGGTALTAADCVKDARELRGEESDRIGKFG